MLVEIMLLSEIEENKSNQTLLMWCETFLYPIDKMTFYVKCGKLFALNFQEFAIVIVILSSECYPCCNPN